MESQYNIAEPVHSVLFEANSFTCILPSLANYGKMCVDSRDAGPEGTAVNYVAWKHNHAPTVTTRQSRHASLVIIKEI